MYGKDKSGRKFRWEGEELDDLPQEFSTSEDDPPFTTLYHEEHSGSQMPADLWQPPHKNKNK